MEKRLKTEIWVKALLRRSTVAGAMATVVKRGENSAGVVLVKVNHLDQKFDVYAQARSAEGELIWIRGAGKASGPEADIDAYIERSRKFDPDLWVVEVEDREGRHFLTEPVELA
jgi:hypothetical protein